MKQLIVLTLSLVIFFSSIDASDRILIIVTNHAEIGDTGTATGYYLSEVAHPWHVFREAGYDVHFASPLGGFAPMDPKSFDLVDPINLKFWHDLEAVQGVVSTMPLSKVQMNEYAAIFFSGGHGTMWDFPVSKIVSERIAEVYEAGKVVAAVCHGPAALVNVTLDNGSPLVAGKRIAAFTNEEEDAVQLTDSMPFMLQTKLETLGAEFVAAPKFSANVVVAERLVTGQNPASAEGAAHAVVKLLKGE